MIMEFILPLIEVDIDLNTAKRIVERHLLDICLANIPRPAAALQKLRT